MIGEERSASDLVVERLDAWFADVAASEATLGISAATTRAAWASLVAEHADDLDLPPGVG